MSNKHSRFKPIPEEIELLATEHNHDPEAIIDIYRALQVEKGELSPEVIADTARAMKLPAGKAYGAATFYSMLNTPARTIRVCDGPACWLKGAAYLRAILEAESIAGSTPEPPWTVERSSCLGLCDRAPAALVGDEQSGPLDLSTVSNLRRGWRGALPDYSHPLPGEVRVLLANTAERNPNEIDSSLAYGAYKGLARALEQTPDQVISEVEASGLRGRGGAGFPTGRKMRLVAQAPAETKYVVCNADESEPLVFKDRVLMDANPHLLLEGIAIAGYAVGAREAFIYIRGEYKSQAEKLERAINQAKEHGWLGKNIQKSSFSFEIHVHRGAGAYICGEETALLESLEGKRGEPRIRPPFPAAYGYHGQPTMLNNVETFATIPVIVERSADWYRSIGSQSQPGTKLYTLLGHVNRPGFFEAPYGLTLRQVIDEFGGGMLPNSTFHFALTGGAAGTIIPPGLLDVPMDYTSVSKGVSLGTGAFLVCDESVSPVVLLREVLYFFEVESCGKCTPCRIGTSQARKILDRMIADKVDGSEAETLMQLADLMQTASFCGLGQAVAIPMKSAINNFRVDFGLS